MCLQGAYIAYLWLEKLKQQDDKTVKRFIVLDVGMFKPEQMPALNMLTIACYQSYLAFVFFLSRALPTLLGDIMLALYPWGWFGPCPDEEKYGMPTRTSPGGDGLGRGVHCWMAYP